MARDSLKAGRRQSAPVPAKPQPRQVERFVIPALLVATGIAATAAVFQRRSGPEAYVAAAASVTVVPKGVRVPPAAVPSVEESEPARRPFMEAAAEGATAYAAADYPRRWRSSQRLSSAIRWTPKPTAISARYWCG